MSKARSIGKMRGKDVRAGIPWVESKSKLSAQSPIISAARDNSKVTLVTQFSIFNAIARFRKISV